MFTAGCDTGDGPGGIPFNMATFTGLTADWGVSVDNASMMNAQMLALVSSGGGTIQLPAAPAGYGIGSDLTVPAGVTLIGAGAGLENGVATTPPYLVNATGATFSTSSVIVTGLSTSGLVPGTLVTDVTTPASISSGTTISTVDGPHQIHLSAAPAANSGVGGDQLAFSGLGSIIIPKYGASFSKAMIVLGGTSAGLNNLAVFGYGNDGISNALICVEVSGAANRIDNCYIYGGTDYGLDTTANASKLWVTNSRFDQSQSYLASTPTNLTSADNIGVCFRIVSGCPDSTISATETYRGAVKLEAGDTRVETCHFSDGPYGIPGSSSFSTCYLGPSPAGNFGQGGNLINVTLDNEGNPNLQSNIYHQSDDWNLVACRFQQGVATSIATPSTISTSPSNVVVGSTAGYPPGGGTFQVIHAGTAYLVTYTGTSGTTTFTGCTLSSGSVAVSANDVVGAGYPCIIASAGSGSNSNLHVTAAQFIRVKTVANQVPYTCLVSFGGSGNLGYTVDGAFIEEAAVATSSYPSTSWATATAVTCFDGGSPGLFRNGWYFNGTTYTLQTEIS